MSDLQIDVPRVAGWLPAQEDLERWLRGHRDRVARTGRSHPSPTMMRFRSAVDADPTLRMYIERMVTETPAGRSYAAPPFASVDEFLAMVDEVLTMAPEYGDEMASTPLAAVLDWTIGTPTGLAAYRDPRLNRVFHDLLGSWSTFLSGPDSLYVLNDRQHGWKSEDAVAAVGIDQFVHDPDDEYWGFTSWNDFFTRRFLDGARPIAAPEDDGVVIAPCEATPYALRTGLARRDRFWAKGQPYSLEDMLQGSPSAARFVGGTVYQAFLSALDYHRWHSPVAGTVREARIIPGTYFSEADSTGSEATEPTDSQRYLAHMATRALFVIEADAPSIGHVAFVPIGMVDVSSCIIAEGVRDGVHVGKGDELGRFQFGGSTYCLVFEPGAISTIELDALPSTPSRTRPVRMGSRLATAI